MILPMNILVVDYLCPVGHKFFNEIQIKSLQNCGVSLSYISRLGYFGEAISLKRALPEKYFTKRIPLIPLSISSRIWDIMKLRMIKKEVENGRYDAIVFLSYDVYSLLLVKLCGVVLLINHVNIDEISCLKTKRLATRLLPSNYHHIALTKRICEYSSSLLNRTVLYVPHGVLKNNYFSVKKHDGKYVFCPITSSCDMILLERILTSEKVISFFKEKGMTLIIKGDNNRPVNSDSIIYLPSFISEEEYQSLLCGALAVFLPYAPSFKYRTSGVFFECLSNSIPVLTNDIDCFRDFESYIAYNYLVNSPEGFIKQLEDLIKHKGCIYYNLEDLEPSIYWKGLFTNCF